MKRINVAVIGCGGIAERAHIPNLLVEPQSKLVAISDLNEERLTTIQEQFNLPKEICYMDYNRILSLKDVDAVIISTPTETHANIAIDAMEAGKHVFIEKPIASTVLQAEKIAEMSKKTALKVMVGYQHRFVSSHRIAKRYIQTGKIGQPFFGEVHSENLIVKMEEGILLDYAVHLIDLLMWYFENLKVTEVAALDYNEEGRKEKHAVVIMNFDNGMIGRIGAFYMDGYTSWSAVDRYVKILGTRGKLVADLTGPAITLYREGTLLSRLRGPHKVMPRNAMQENLPLTDAAYKEEMHDFIQSLVHNRKPSVDAEQGLKVQKVLDAILQSIKEKAFFKVNL